MSKHKLLGIIALIMFFLVTGCSNSKSTPDTKVQDQTNQGTESKENTPPETTKLESDTDLAQQLEAEKGIESVMVQIVEGEQPAVNVDIVINNEQEMSPDQVVEKYSQLIKEKYPKHTIDIIVVKDGKLLKQANFK